MTAPPGQAQRLPIGIGFALVSAVLFGLSTPLVKLLLAGTPPLLLAGLLYAGSGLGLSVVRLLRPASREEGPLGRAHLPWLAGSVIAGGIVGPVLLMTGLHETSA
jgi:drug/metabolite transporter (DMT)-like permease